MKGSCDFGEGNSPLYITPMSDLVARGIVVVDIKYF